MTHITAILICLQALFLRPLIVLKTVPYIVKIAALYIRLQEAMLIFMGRLKTGRIGINHGTTFNQ